MIYHRWSTTIEHSSTHIGLQHIQDHILTYYNVSDTISDNYNIFDDESKPIQDLKDIAYSKFSTFANVNFGVNLNEYHSVLKGWLTPTENHAMANHNHMGAWFSSVYYIMAEEEDQGGEIIFTDPRTNANRGYDQKFAKHFKEFVIQPKTGDYVIFPSFLYHWVNKFTSRFRIAIPIDIYLFEKTRQY